MQYDAMITSDALGKKRKRWRDVTITINDNGAVSVVDHEDAPQKVIFSGVLDQKKIELAMDGEVIALNRLWLLQLGDRVESKVIDTASVEMLTSIRPLSQQISRDVLKTSVKLISSNLINKPFKAPTNVVCATNSNNKVGSAVKVSIVAPEYSLPICYEDCIRKKTINDSFNNPLEYARQFSSALIEEIMLSISNGIRGIEKRAFRVLGIDESGSRFSLFSSTANNEAGSTIKSSSVTNKRQISSQIPSVESVLKQLRSTGLAYAVNVEVIVSNPNVAETERENNSWGNKSQRYNEKKVEVTVADLAETKLYLKFSPGSNDCPKGAESFGKGDIWLIWKMDSDFYSVDDIIQRVDDGSMDRNKVQRLRELYIEARRNGYPFPFYGGLLFYPTWLVKSCWHAISDKGMLQIASINNSVEVPSFIGSLAKNRSTGIINQKVNGIRIGSEMTNLQGLDLLLSAFNLPKKRADKLPLQASIKAVRNSLDFSNLLESFVFQTIMSSNKLIPNAYMSKLVKQRTAVHNDDIINAVITKFAQSFQLNEDQIVVMSRVGKWFGDSALSPGDHIVNVHGCFGSGKSTLIVAICLLIRSLSDLKILVSSNTNVAVDRVMNLLSAYNSSESNVVNNTVIARIGCINKIDKALRKHLVMLTENRMHAQKDIMKIMQNDKDEALQKLLQETKKESFIDNQKRVLNSANIVGVTCCSAVNSLLLPLEFPILILDESSQMNEVLSLLPMSLAKCCFIIIVGDPQQLPPTLSHATTLPNYDRSGASSMSSNKPQYLNRTLFDRIVNLNYDVTLLRKQYRCHPLIGSICSELFYKNRLINGVTELDRQPIIPELPPVYVALDDHSEERRGDSFINTGEAMEIQKFIQALYTKRSAIGTNFSIGIICLYKSQVYLLQNLLRDYTAVVTNQLTIATVDSFQGNEMDCIIIATTRRVPTEFLSNPNRINVAISRAKNNLVVFACSKIMHEIPCWSFLMQKSVQNVKL